MAPMRILICNEHYGLVGGAEVYLLDVISRLEGMGYEVGVLHDSPAGETMDSTRPVYRVPGSLGFLHSQSASTVRAVKEAVQQFAPDVIYVIQGLNPAALHALVDRAPTLRYEMGLRLTCPSGRRMPRTWDGICTKPFDALCLWKAHTQLCMPRRPDTALKVWIDVRKNQRAHTRFHRIFLPSRYIYRLLVESGMPQERLEVLHLYTELNPAIEANSPSSERRILALGRPTPEKGFGHLIEGLNHITDPTTLEIAGESPYLEELRQLAARAPHRHTVVFSGWVPRQRLTEAYARARVVAVPSTWPEPFGIVGIEAMAHGLPAVAFDVGGISDWLADGRTGALIPRKDIPAMARALDAYLSDPSLARRHGAAGREEVRRRFLPEHHINRLLDAFEEALEAGRRLDMQKG